jgi:acetyl-CoA acyltransferase 1
LGAFSFANALIASPLGTGKAPISEDIQSHGPAMDCYKPAGWWCEEMTSEFYINREDMDAFAAASFQRAEHAQEAGFFADEIVPFNAYLKDPVTGTRSKITVTKDDGIRYGTTVDVLGKIRSAFPQWGHGRTTGGNASQITDGVAATMLMTRAEAERLGCEVLGKWVTTTLSGVTFCNSPRHLLIG